MYRIGVVLLLVGCGRVSRVESLVDAGWLGEACSASVGLEVPPEALLQAHLRGSRELVIGVIPGSRYPSAPAYGTDVLLAQLALNESDPPALLRGVSLAVHGDGATLRSCPECGSTWIAEHLGLPVPKSPARGLLGLLALPLTMAWDLALAPVRVLQAAANQEVVPWLSGYALDGFTPAITVAEDGECTAERPCTDTWVGAPAAAASAIAEDTLAVTWRWRHADCDVAATWERPLPAGKDLPTRLTEAAKEPLSFSDRPATWSVHAR